MFPEHPGVGLCDCSCQQDSCTAATCDATKWTSNCEPVGTNIDPIYREQCERILLKKRKKREAGQLMDDYSDKRRPAFSLEEPEIEKVNSHCVRGQGVSKMT